MSDIVERLRSMARAEHDDLSIGDEAAAEVERLRAALREAMKIPRPWLDGNITREEWDAACDAVFAALSGKGET